MERLPKRRKIEKEEKGDEEMREGGGEGGEEREKKEEREEKEEREKEEKEEREEEEEEERGREWMKDGSHPYGVEPLGHLMLMSFPFNVRDCSLGPLFSSLSDELILHILGTMEAKDLVSLSQVCQSFYVFSNYDDLWKSLFLLHFSDKVEFNKTWKRTYIDTKKPGFCHFDPLKISNFFSDFLYQGWYCSSIGIAPNWLQKQNIDRVSGLSVEDFNEKYRKKNRPVIFTDVVKKWDSFSLWTDQYLLQICQDTKFTAGQMSCTFRQYLNYEKETKDELPLYIFDKKFVEKVPQLRKDYSIPPYFEEEDLFSLMENRPDFRWLIIGPTRSGSSYHVDPNSTSAWNGVIRGRKKWVMFPPNCPPPGVHPSPDGAVVTSPVSVMEWFKNYYQECRKCPVKPIEFIQEAGEMVYVPRGWWHIVLNLEFSIAITQNFVDSENLSYVLPFLRDKKDQISGFLERETLHKQFNNVLKTRQPDLLLKAKQEEKEREKRKRSVWEEKVLNEDSQQQSFSLLSFF